MAKVEGLNLRGLQYYVRVIVPDDLKVTYGKSRVNLSLGTSDRRAATLLATIKRAEWLADFEAKRSALKPSAVAAISPQLAALLAERVRAAVLMQDDGIRSNLPVLDPFIERLRHAANFGGDGFNGRPQRRVVASVLLHHTHCAFANLG